MTVCERICNDRNEAIYLELSDLRTSEVEEKGHKTKRYLEISSKTLSGSDFV